VKNKIVSILLYDSFFFVCLLSLDIGLLENCKSVDALVNNNEGMCAVCKRCTHILSLTEFAFSS